MVQSTEKSLTQLSQDSRLKTFGIKPEDYVFKHLGLSTDPDDHEMAVDASSGDLKFRHVVPNNETHVIYRLMMWGIASAKIMPEGFFTIAALGEGDGMLVRAINTDGSVVKDFADGEEIRHHAHIGMLSGVDVATEVSGGNAASWTIRWTLAEAGAPLKLTAGRGIEIVQRANLSAFTMFEAMVQGIRIRPVKP